MDAGTEPRPGPGQPRSARDAAFLKRFDAWMQVPIIVSAVLPLLITPTSEGWVGVTVGVVTWLIFLVDYVVRTRHVEHYLRTRLGRLDLVVVVATAPWYLLPGATAGRFVVLLRLARLIRVLVATRGSRRLFARVGRVAVVALGVVVLGSLIAYHAEHKVNPEFATIGDALWWGIVTLTTVGYGDIVPITAAGRWAGVMIMITGIGVLGVLSGSLASFFRLGEGVPAGQPTGTDQPEGAAVSTSATGAAPASRPVTATDSALAALTTEVAALRAQVGLLAAALTRSGPAPPSPPVPVEPPR